MKKTDLGIVMIHWVMAISLLGVAISGLIYKFKEYHWYFSWLFLAPPWMGSTHIWCGIFVIIFLTAYLFYLKQSNLLSRMQLRIKGIISGGQIRWKYVTNILYWLLFIVIILETISGILLTKLINPDVLYQYFFIPKQPLIFLHFHLVWFILAFPALHIIVHWLDGGQRKLMSMFRPSVFPRRPSLIEIMAGMKEENTKLKAKIKAHECASPSRGPKPVSDSISRQSGDD